MYLALQSGKMGKMLGKNQENVLAHLAGTLYCEQSGKQAVAKHKARLVYF